MTIFLRLPSLWLVTAAVASVALALSLAGPAVGPAALVPIAAAATARPPAAATGLPRAIEPLAAYVPANSCNPTPKLGSVKLGRLLTTTYAGTRYGLGRACGPLPTSEHYDGRAVDWMNSIRTAKGAAQAKAVVTWLMAKDAAGNPQANARRLGVMYVIWNNKIWGAYSADQGWRPYSSCAKHPERSWDTTCHRDHIHLSLSWEGAMGRTSFWTKRVAAQDYGPCRPADLSWAAAYTKANPNRCQRYPSVRPPKGASSTLKTLTTYSGMELRAGSSGAGVKAVQKVVGVTTDGVFGSKTTAAVKKWQKARKLPVSGVVTPVTWRALLKNQAQKVG